MGLIGVVWWQAVLWGVAALLVGVIAGALTLAISVVVLIAGPVIVTLVVVALGAALLRQATRLSR